MCKEKTPSIEYDDQALQAEVINPFESITPTAPTLTAADPAIVAAAEVAKTQIQLAYFMAVQNPRNRHAAWGKIIEACQRPAFASKAIYNKPVGSSTITGPSIRMAEEIIRHWGNIMVRTQVIYEDDHKRRVTVQAIDLETNNQYIKEIVTNKTVERKFAGKDREILGERKNTNGETIYIVKATDDEMHNKEASMISKAIRNEGLRLIPADVIEDALNTALEVRSKADNEDPDKQLKTLISWFQGLKVDVKALEEWLGHEIKTISPLELESLRGIYRAICDQETSWAAVMEEKLAADPHVQASNHMERTAEKIKQELSEVEVAEQVAAEEPEADLTADELDLMLQYLIDQGLPRQLHNLAKEAIAHESLERKLQVFNYLGGDQDAQEDSE